MGVAKRDITPHYPVRLNGFGFRRTESEGVTQPIWAKALAIGADDERPVVLITLDSLGVRQSQVDEVARRLAQRFGIQRDRVTVTFSHSHTTPKVVGASDTIFSSPIPAEHQRRIERYTAELIDAMEAVAAAALEAREPATLSWAVGEVGFAKNRRPQGGPVDHSLPILVVKAADTGDIRAIFTTYACHCVTLSNNKISGDWAGYAQHAIEQRHPGVVALTSIGCGSDANPDSGVVNDNTAAAADQGAQIADEVDRLLASPLKPVSGPIKIAAARIDLPLLAPPGRAELEKLAANEDPAGYNARFQLEKLDRGEQLLTAIDYPIQTWEFGSSLAMAFLAGEVCCDYAVELREKLDADRLWVHGYANDFCAYIPSERLLREGGYGGGAEIVYFALPSKLAAGLQSKIIDQTCRMISDEYHRPAVADGGAAPWSVERSLAAMRVKPGFVVEAVAAEPLVADPVAIDFAPSGQLWVAEMPDYSRFPDEHFERHGNVRLLTDRDGDGRFDDMIVFVDGLQFPTGVKAWRDGVLVCDAPDVIYFRDADGDGRADERTVLLTGFETHNAQARVNSLRWGLDNWLYGACGLFGGTIRTSTGREIALGQRDFRFRPESGELEPITGRTQQGRARNDWGDWFGCENGSLLDHYPLVDRYLARNPRLVPPPPERSVPEPAAIALRPIGELTLFELSGPPGRPTAACGLDFYRDELLGADYANNAFVAEPVNQLVRRFVLSSHGGTFRGTLAADEQDREFLASADPWFRPVQICTGLDGCLYVVDMHRAVIEHQKFIPAETLRSVDLLAGQQQGRIYRVRPAAAAPRVPVDLTKLTTAELVAALETPNGPRRDAIHELLVGRRDLAAIAPLRRLAVESAIAATRLQALCVLDGLEGLDVDSLASALQDAHPAVRRHAIRLSETWLSQTPELATRVQALADDGDPQVQMQLAYSLGEWNDPRVAETLAKIALANSDDAYVLAAAWSSVRSDNADDLVAALLAHGVVAELPATVIEPALRLALDFGKLEDVELISDALAADEQGRFQAWQLDVAATLMRRHRQTAASEQALRNGLAPLVASAQRLIDDENVGDTELIGGLKLAVAAASGEAQRAELLEPHLGQLRSPAVQQAAVELAAHISGVHGVELLMEAWPRMSRVAREQAFAAIVSRKSHALMLLGAIRSGRLAAATLDTTQRQRLLESRDDEIRAMAAAVLSAPANSDRHAIVRDYLASAPDRGDVKRGKELFAKHCANCHRLDGVGHEVGPDLSALSSRERTGLFESILDPNRAVDERYRSYTAWSIDGLAYAGVLAAETAGAVTIVDQQGKSHVLLRTDLESLEMSASSLMPEGFERELTPDEVNHLAAYLGAL